MTDTPPNDPSSAASPGGARGPGLPRWLLVLGIPVATVAIDGATNGAILAITILALEDESLAKQLIAYREELAEETFREVHRR